MTMNQTLKISDKLIERAEEISKTSDTIQCICHSEDRGFFITSWYDLINSSVPTFYDTETKSTDFIKRHLIVKDFLSILGFKNRSLDGFERCCSRKMLIYPLSEFIQNFS